MVEVEVKLPIDSIEELQSDLECLRFVKTGMFCEEDCYFDNDTRQIRTNGQALRIRKVTDLQSDHSDVVITFKGKKMDQVSMSRRELEIQIADAETGIQIFEALGFRIVPPKVIKIRNEYKIGQMTACIDQVQNLGDFLELEIVIQECEDKDEALGQIESVLQKLGYSLKDTVRNSYLSMLQHTQDEEI